MRRTRPGATLVALVLAVTTAGAATIHVPLDQPTIQAGIDVAASGDTVLVASGTYTGFGNRDLDPGDRAMFVLSEEGSAATVIECQGSDTDPHRAFYVVRDDSTAFAIEGFTIRNGYASEKGGGIYCENTILSLVDCVIEDCEAGTSQSDWDGDGGGMYSISCTLAVDSCAFRSCQTGYFANGSGSSGGGVAAVNCSGWFNECEFSDNSTGAAGGGLAGSDLTLTSCLFVGNRAGDIVIGRGGGLCGNVTLQDVGFVGNQAEESGGGMSGNGVLTRVFFRGNYAGSRGGGLHGDGQVTDSVFMRNESVSGGGACGGEVFERVAFIENVAWGSGGGVTCGENSEFRECTFSGNFAGYGGSAVSFHSGSPSFERVIVAFGQSFGADTPVHCESGPCTPELECSNVYGNEGGDWLGCIAGQLGVNGNISSDPLFCDPDNDDYTLNEWSLCAPENNSCGVQIGAYPIGCGSPLDILVSDDGLGEAPTLQAGIDACVSGGRVVAHPGVFSGDGNRDLDFQGKTIGLVSIGGSAVTTVDCENLGRGVLFDSGEDTLSYMRGFTIERAQGDTGAGILCRASSPIIDDCVVTSSSATSGAGIACVGGASPRVSSVDLHENTGGFGAGFFCESGSTPLVSESVMSGNWGLQGAGIWVSDSSPDFTDVIVDSNSATDGAGLYCTTNGNAALRNCGILSNSATGKGGGVYSSSSSPLLENVTFFANSADEGGGVYSLNSSPVMRGALVAFSGSGEGLLCAGAPQPILEYTDIFGNAGGDAQCGLDLGGNISADPLLCDIWEGDLSLCANSPCLVAGAPSGRIGMYGEGCSNCTGTGLQDSADEPEVWGRPFLSATPSPFQGRTSIRYQPPPTASWVTVTIYSVSGRKVATLLSEPVTLASRMVQWDGCDDSGRRVASGVYLCRLLAGDESLEQKITLLR